MDLLYIEANAFVPTGRVSSSARKGDKWSKQAKPGDVVFLRTTESGRVFGRAAVVAAELVTFKDVIERAGENHVAYDPANAGKAHGAALTAALEAAYGPSEPGDAFTILTILPLNE